MSYLPKSSIRLRYASKAEIQTNSYKNSVKSDEFTEFLVRPTRFERATYRVGVCHSIQLSYERIYEINGGTPVIAF